MEKKSKTTMESLAISINPNWGVYDWFEWPPNMFALISIILQRTGAYKLCLTKNDGIWDDPLWQDNVQNDALTWLDLSNQIIIGGKQKIKKSDIKGTKLLFNNIELIAEQWDKIELDNLRLLNTNNDIGNFISSLIAIYAISDYSCRGLGLIGENIKENNKAFKLLNFIANLLLNNYGSLATIPKFHGIVLPKMRTPQSGLTIRSLSHYLTFHITEVEVIWRTFPWLNNHKQSLNVLAIPYPFKIKESNFNIIEDKYHSVRYFKGMIDETDEKINNKIDFLVDKIKEHLKNNSEIDILVLPETALNKKSYYQLLNKLESSFSSIGNNEKSKLFQLPIVICGVLDPIEEEYENKNKSFSFHNEVRIATYFGNKWYEIKQRKHHRWKLDRNQVLQYNLEGKFITDKDWFEHSSISQRRLTILSPNSWLALTSLICEDLARQEPVSEIIRGIGPTLLVALLSDGPQLTHRWSARYASILADDPGTAVLSLTSLGMIKRSQKTEPTSNNNTETNKKKSYTVGLWKDMIRGYKELNLTENNSALLFTISASFIEEFTIDGRTDYTNASVFRMDTITPYQFEIKEKENNKTDDVTSELKPKFGYWEDIRDLSALMYAIDAMIDILSSNVINKKEQINTILTLLNYNQKVSTSKNNFYSEITEIINISWENPERFGIETNKIDTSEDKTSPKSQMIESVNILKEILKDKILFTKDNSFDIYKYLFEKFDSELSSLSFEENRIKIITYYAFLYDIMSKISKWKPKKNEGNDKDKLIKSKDLIDLKQKIKTLLEKK